MGLFHFFTISLYLFTMMQQDSNDTLKILRPV